MAEQEPSDRDYLVAAVQGLNEIRSTQIDQQRQLLALAARDREALAAQQAQAAQPKAQPRVAPHDLQSINARLGEEVITNPLRVFAEHAANVKADTKAEVIAEVRQEMARTESERKYREYVGATMAANQDLHGHEYKVAEYIEWAKANRPDLTRFEEQVGAAVAWTREFLQREFQVRAQAESQAHERRMRGAMPYPSAGTLPYAREPMNELDARRARLSAGTSVRDRAMAGPRLLVAQGG